MGRVGPIGPSVGDRLEPHAITKLAGPSHPFCMGLDHVVGLDELGPPGGRAIFIRVVGHAPDSGPVQPDREDVPIGLVVVRVRDRLGRYGRVVRCENQPARVRTEPGVVRSPARPALNQLPQPGPVRMNQVDLEAAASRVITVRREGDPFPVRRPRAHRIGPVPLRQPPQPAALALNGVHYVEVLVPRPARPENHKFSVRRRRRKSVVAVAGQSDDPGASGVRIGIGEANRDNVHRGHLAGEGGPYARIDDVLPLVVPSCSERERIGDAAPSRSVSFHNVDPPLVQTRDERDSLAVGGK
uniref:Uncharacterized protein n=1 Tax=Nymphaea colorata TaxID=210225 RepID=A0A5K0Z175_9MAGN